jgi:protein-tyrosine sulfotransferase
MADPFPIFILSCERSGSTLLRYILDTHPEIACPGELYLGRLTKNLRETVSRTLGLTAGDNAHEREKTTQEEVHCVLNGLLSKYAALRGKKFWCDKTPLNLKDLADLNWAFPNARYICLYRHSLDVVQSCLELPEKAYIWWALPYMVKHRQNPVAAVLDSWVEKTQIMLSFEKRQRRTCRIQYEVLVADPVKALNPVFQFLGLDWNSALLEQVFGMVHDQGGGDEKIKLTHKIETDRVGHGTKIDPALLASVPPGLRLSQKALHLELGYP